MAYGDRFNEVMPVIQAKIRTVQQRLFDASAAMDERASALLAADPRSADAIEEITSFGVETGEGLVAEWRDRPHESNPRYRHQALRCTASRLLEAPNFRSRLLDVSILSLPRRRHHDGSSVAALHSWQLLELQM